MGFKRTEPRDYLCLEQRLICLSTVDLDSPLVNGSHCWIYLGPTQRVGRHGYGKISLRVPGQKHPRSLLVHRVAYETFVGPIPPGHDIDHECVTGLCICPAHLSPQLPADNQRLRIERTLRKAR